MIVSKFTVIQTKIDLRLFASKCTLYAISRSYKIIEIRSNITILLKQWLINC